MSDGSLVVFKSVEDFWRIERNGNKPNTVRLLTDAEYSTRLDFARSCLMAGEPASICMVCVETKEPFFRRITDISQIGTAPARRCGSRTCAEWYEVGTGRCWDCRKHDEWHPIVPAMSDPSATMTVANNEER